VGGVKKNARVSKKKPGKGQQKIKRKKGVKVSCQPGERLMVLGSGETPGGTPGPFEVGKKRVRFRVYCETPDVKQKTCRKKKNTEPGKINPRK